LCVLINQPDSCVSIGQPKAAGLIVPWINERRGERESSRRLVLLCEREEIVDDIMAESLAARQSKIILATDP